MSGYYFSKFFIYCFNFTKILKVRDYPSNPCYPCSIFVVYIVINIINTKQLCPKRLDEIHSIHSYRFSFERSKEKLGKGKISPDYIGKKNCLKLLRNGYKKFNSSLQFWFFSLATKIFWTTLNTKYTKKLFWNAE